MSRAYEKYISTDIYIFAHVMYLGFKNDIIKEPFENIARSLEVNCPSFLALGPSCLRSPALEGSCLRSYALEANCLRISALEASCLRSSALEP